MNAAGLNLPAITAQATFIKLGKPTIFPNEARKQTPAAAAHLSRKERAERGAASSQTAACFDLNLSMTLHFLRIKIL